MADNGLDGIIGGLISVADGPWVRVSGEARHFEIAGNALVLIPTERGDVILLDQPSCNGDGIIEFPDSTAALRAKLIKDN